MEAKIESIKILIASFLSSISIIFGQTSKIIISLILLMIIDTTFGWVKGFKGRCWKAKEALWGLAGKIVELILISLLYIVNWVFNIEFIIYSGLYYFIFCEIASILENYSTINQNLPKFLINFLNKVKFNIGDLFISNLKKFLEKFLKNQEYEKDE